MLVKKSLMVLLLSSLAACQTLTKVDADFDASLTNASEVRECFSLLALVDDLVAEHGQPDAGPVRVEGFPYLRVDRFHAALATEATQSGESFTQWINALRDLDAEARSMELANLPTSIQEENPNLAQRVDACADTAMVLQMENGVARRNVLAAIEVPDDYRYWQRLLGFYPIAIPFLNRGVNAWHDDARELFATPIEKLPRQGRLVRYRPPTQKDQTQAESSGRAYSEVARNPLGIPRPTDEELQQLFAKHAPIIEQNVLSSSDRIGMPMHGPAGPDVDTAVPVLFTDTAYTKFQGKNLLQLLYLVWYPERPSSGLLDILAGDIDGLYWRVTLDENGEPLLYDTIHACGCYHYFFPARDWPTPVNSGWFTEPVLAPHSLKTDGAAVLRVEAVSHYLQGVRANTGSMAVEQEQHYRMLPYDLLRQLPKPGGGSQSWFASSALLEGSERAERWILWPTGVPSPGAMRQWGHHATAFVGSRHFDEPELIERIFFGKKPLSGNEKPGQSDRIAPGQHRRRLIHSGSRDGWP